MSAVCPACGVAVVPGYVRCPKCQTPLPAVGRRGSSSAVHAGGTAVASPSWPIFAIAGGGAILLIAVVAIAMRGVRRPHRTRRRKNAISPSQSPVILTRASRPRPVRRARRLRRPPTASTPRPSAAMSSAHSGASGCGRPSRSPVIAWTSARVPVAIRTWDRCSTPPRPRCAVPAFSSCDASSRAVPSCSNAISDRHPS